MAKIVKSISLDAETIPLAEAKDNFSAWVREQLYHEIVLEKDCIFFTASRDRKVWDPKSERYTVKNELRKEICNGMRPIRCPKCYPDGKPTSEDWLAYSRFEIDRDELIDRTSRRYEAISVANKGLNDAPTPHLRPQKAYVRRLLTWIWSYIW